MVGGRRTSIARRRGQFRDHLHRAKIETDLEHSAEESLAQHLQHVEVVEVAEEADGLGEGMRRPLKGTR